MPLRSNATIPLFDRADGASVLAVLDELTLTYEVVERRADGETRSVRRHIPSLREARAWAGAHAAPGSRSSQSSQSTPVSCK